MKDGREGGRENQESGSGSRAAVEGDVKASASGARARPPPLRLTTETSRFSAGRSPSPHIFGHLVPDAEAR